MNVCCLETVPLKKSRSKHGKRLIPVDKRHCGRLVRNARKKAAGNKPLGRRHTQSNGMAS